MEISQKMQALSESLGLAHDMVLSVSVLLAAIPLGLVHRQLSGAPHVQLGFNLVAGLGAVALIFGLRDLAVSFALSLVAYAMVYCQRYGLWPSVPVIASMVVLCWFQFRSYTEYYMQWRADVTTLVMLSVVRYSTFSYDFFDGRKGQTTPHAITGALPSLFTFLSFVYCIFTVAAGPAILFKQYHDSIFNPTPHAIGYSAFRACLSLATVVTGMAVLQTYPNLSVEFLFTSDFANLSIFRKIVQVYLAMLFVRLKYYAAWNLAELGCLAAGLGADGRASNADFYHVESARSLQVVAGRWNRLVAHWLKNCIYKRLNFKNRFAAIGVTRAVSAFWHGFYPGYYLTFLFLLFLDKAESVCQERLGSWFTPDAPLYRLRHVASLLSWVHMFASLSYYGIAFFVYSIDRGLHIWKELFYVGHVFHVVLILAVSLVPKYASKKID